MSRKRKSARHAPLSRRRLACSNLSALIVFSLLAGFPPATSHAADFTLGENGWQLERLSDDFVLLRSEIFTIKRDERPKRIGLMIAACERDKRRVRFQMGDTPRSPSILPTARARAIIRGIAGADKREPAPIYPAIHLFNDGSFELQETAELGGNVRGFLDLLTRSPTELEVILFKGPDTGAFTRGTAFRFELRNIFESLGTIYGFQGLCLRTAG
jgi:hypothetical protein